MDRNFLKRIVWLVFGCYLYGLGLTFYVYNGLGMDPWNVFHDGISLHTGMGIGVVNVIVSIIVIFAAVAMGEPFGIGTIFNSTLIGSFLQININMGIFSVPETLIMKIVFLLLGMIIIGFATYYYISPAFGSGPRDSLSVALSKRLNIKMGYTKSIVDMITVVVGIMLGGRFGIGTIISSVMGGVFVQMVFNMFSFDVKNLKHENIIDTMKRIKRA
ncbi:MAG: hypothetical protein Q4D95_00670 [Peptoniphilus sp.]|nr:hypothetical protein [Peptoniphilus sp.]